MYYPGFSVSLTGLMAENSLPITYWAASSNLRPLGLTTAMSIKTVPDMLQQIHQSILVEMGDSNAGDEDITPEVLPPGGAAQSLDFPQIENEAAHVSV